jgi:CRP-like cAMP-binding protein
VGTILEDFLSRFVTSDFPRGAPLLPPESARPFVAYVREGLVRGLWSEATILVAGDGQWVGLDGLRFAENRVRYVALAPTRAVPIPLRDLLDRAPAAVLRDALKSSGQAWFAAASTLSLVGAPLSVRVLAFLHEVSRRHPRTQLELPRQVVAEMVGISRQALSPVLQQLEREGLVGLGYGRITIPDPARLALARDGGHGASDRASEGASEGPAEAGRALGSG